MPQADNADIVLYYAPKTRALRAVWLLEELGEPYRIELVDYANAGQKQPELLKLNPMGKLPIVVDHGTPIAESGAIITCLADKYSPGDLAPLPDDPNRADYLRWLFFAVGVMEPAYCEKFFGWELNPQQVAWGSFADMETVVTAAVAPGPWLLGDRFTAADVLMGFNLHFGLLTKVFPETGAIADYVARCAERPAFQRVMAIEEGYIEAREEKSG
jgi:glutathione S-transferase